MFCYSHTVRDSFGRIEENSCLNMQICEFTNSPLARPEDSVPNEFLGGSKIRSVNQEICIQIQP